MATCIRCDRHYEEPPREEGDHDCPKCGLTPEFRARWYDGYELVSDYENLSTERQEKC